MRRGDLLRSQSVQATLEPQRDSHTGFLCRRDASISAIRPITVLVIRRTRVVSVRAVADSPHGTRPVCTRPPCSASLSCVHCVARSTLLTVRAVTLDHRGRTKSQLRHTTPDACEPHSEHETSTIQAESTGQQSAKQGTARGPRRGYCVQPKAKHTWSNQAHTAIYDKVIVQVDLLTTTYTLRNR